MAGKREEEAKYKQKIADLHAELEAVAKQLNERQSERDEAKRETEKLRKELAKLQGDVADLKHEVENLTNALAEKKAQAQTALKKDNDAASRARLEKDSLEFAVKQLHAKATDLNAKLAELPQIQQRYTEAKVKLESAEKAVKAAQAKAQKIVDEAEKMLAAATARDAQSKLREARVTDSENSCKKKLHHLEFYRNRLVAYCSEKGLPPPPAFDDGQA